MEFRDKPMQNLVRIPEKDICKNAQKQNTWNVNDLQIMISSPVNKICDLS